MNFLFRFPAVHIALCFSGTFTSCNNANKTSLAEVATKTDMAEAKQALISMYDFVMTKDLSDSLIFNQWVSFFTNDVVWMSSKGQAPDPVDLRVIEVYLKTTRHTLIN